MRMELSLPVTVCFTAARERVVDRDLDRMLLQLGRSLPIASGITGHPALESGHIPPERVYSALLAARRERERALDRPCEVYLFGGRKPRPKMIELLRSCGFRFLIGRQAPSDNGPEELFAAESLLRVSARFG